MNVKTKQKKNYNSALGENVHIKSGGLILNVSPLEKDYVMLLYKFAEAIRLYMHFVSFCEYKKKNIVLNENWV